jgi:hypothetical protein
MERVLHMGSTNRNILRNGLSPSVLLLLGLVFVLLPCTLFGQERETPLGTQKPFPVASPPQEPPTPPREPPGQTIARVLAAYGPQWTSGQVQDSVAEGKLTYFTVDGSQVTFNVTLVLKGDHDVQRLIKQDAVTVREGSNGTERWLSAGAFTGVAAGHTLQFIESQTVRSVQSLLNYQSRAATLHGIGRENNIRVLEAEDKDGRKTNYYIDEATWTISKIEFVTGQSKDAFSRALGPDVETYRFSDFRKIQGLLTPFTIERFINGFKAEEMQFSAVSYNTSVKDDVFRP